MHGERDATNYVYWQVDPVPACHTSPSSTTVWYAPQSTNLFLDGIEKLRKVPLAVLSPQAAVDDIGGGAHVSCSLETCRLPAAEFALRSRLIYIDEVALLPSCWPSSRLEFSFLSSKSFSLILSFYTDTIV